MALRTVLETPALLERVLLLCDDESIAHAAQTCRPLCVAALDASLWLRRLHAQFTSNCAFVIPLEALQHESLICTPGEAMRVYADAKRLNERGTASLADAVFFENESDEVLHQALRSPDTRRFWRCAATESEEGGQQRFGPLRLSLRAPLSWVSAVTVALRADDQEEVRNAPSAFILGFRADEDAGVQTVRTPPLQLRPTASAQTFALGSLCIMARHMDVQLTEEGEIAHLDVRGVSLSQVGVSLLRVMLRHLCRTSQAHSLVLNELVVERPDVTTLNDIEAMVDEVRKIDRDFALEQQHVSDTFSRLMRLCTQLGLASQHTEDEAEFNRHAGSFLAQLPSEVLSVFDNVHDPTHVAARDAVAQLLDQFKLCGPYIVYLTADADVLTATESRLTLVYSTDDVPLYDAAHEKGSLTLSEGLGDMLVQKQRHEDALVVYEHVHAHLKAAMTREVIQEKAQRAEAQVVDEHDEKSDEEYDS